MESNNPKNTQAEVYQRLVDTLAQNDATAMVGAGSSMRVGYPSLDGLLRLLSTRAVKIEPSKKALLDSLHGSKPLLCADEIKKILGPDEFYAQLVNIFGPLNPKYV